MSESFANSFQSSSTEESNPILSSESDFHDVEIMCDKYNAILFVSIYEILIV